MKNQISLLEKKTLTALLEVAKTNLEKHPELQPVIFAQVEGEPKPFALPVQMKEAEHEAKAFRLFAMGETLRKMTGKKITEAVFISDTYYLTQDKNDTTPTNFPISNNPLRREAIMLCGRNSTGDKRVLLMQPYTRTGDKIIFDKTPIDDTKTASTTGLLDYFFSAGEGKFSDLTNDIEYLKRHDKN